jgi:hypothetical protein
MSDISISFPWWVGVWFVAGQAAPVTTIVVVTLVAALVFARRAGSSGLSRWLQVGLVPVGAVWLCGISYWAYGLADEISTRIYEARHRNRLDEAAVVGGISLPPGAWVSIDEHGRLYGIETAPDASVAIDGVRWHGDIHLVMPDQRRAGQGIVQSGILAADALLQGTPCRAGNTAEFSEDGGELLYCTLARRSAIAAEIPTAGGSSTQQVACAADREIAFRIIGRFLERCVLAEAATVGGTACAGGEEIEFSGDGLAACTLAAAQRVGAFDLPAGAHVRFIRGHVSNIETPRSSAPLVISGLELPPGATVALCDLSEEINYLSIPDDRYMTIAGVKLTGRINFDCGRFEWGTLFADTVLRGRALPRNALVSREDVLGH